MTLCFAVNNQASVAVHGVSRRTGLSLPVGFSAKSNQFVQNRPRYLRALREKLLVHRARLLDLFLDSDKWVVTVDDEDRDPPSEPPDEMTDSQIFNEQEDRTIRGTY